jgi:DnaJ-class molecular chaperone
MWYKVFMGRETKRSAIMAKIKVKVSCSGECGNDDCEGHEHELPAKNAVCNDCEGFGMVLNPSMRGHCYTQEEFNEFSEDEREAYFTRGGMYDVECPTCKGNKVILVIDRDGLRKDHAAIVKRYDADVNQRAREAREEAAILRMESGGY